jgi:hypothetical protein
MRIIDQHHNASKNFPNPQIQKCLRRLLWRAHSSDGPILSVLSQAVSQILVAHQNETVIEGKIKC